ncbi:hypothetical protein KUTeg_003399 [Tegillarca granosa]|uniref:Sodium-coupled monocarboxylate transporter 1 n=1 Tax=Tegillarca granosa TaxID=220873 RepID=A0ABQ9FM15_TEGGR|nr:hypothetical protein KUTeg_003399 [Tegillarca granosa]
MTLGDGKRYSFQTGVKNSFTPLDYVLFSATLVISTAIGVFYAIKDRNRHCTKDFLLAGGKMNFIPVAMSLLASFMSAITLLGTPAEMYNFGTMYWWIGLSYFFTMFMAAHIYIPVFYNLRVTSAYEGGMKAVLSLDPSVRHSVWSLVIGGAFLWVSIYGTNQAQVQRAITCGSLKRTQLAIWLNFPGLCVILYLCSLVGIVMYAFYSTCDPIKFGLIMASDQMLKFRNANDIIKIERAHRIDTKYPEKVRPIVVKFSNYPIHEQIRKMSNMLDGTKYGFEQQFPREIQSRRKELVLIMKEERRKGYDARLSGDKLILYPLFVMDVMAHVPGVPGLFVACIFSGTLSTISSGLNSLAAVMLQDIIKPYIVPDLSERRATLVAKCLAVGYGVLGLAMTYVASQLGNILQAALQLFGMIGAPLLGLFTLGMIFPWANTWGAFSGLFSSLLLMFWIGIGAYVEKPQVYRPPIEIYGCNWNLTLTSVISNQSIVEAIIHNQSSYTTTITSTSVAVSESNPITKLYTLSYLWYSPTAMLIVCVVGMIVSLITGRTDPKTIDARVICPIFDVLFPYLPERIRKPLRFGVNHKGVSKISTEISDELSIS